MSVGSVLLVMVVGMMVVLLLLFFQVAHEPAEEVASLVQQKPKCESVYDLNDEYLLHNEIQEVN